MASVKKDFRNSSKMPQTSLAIVIRSIGEEIISMKIMWCAVAKLIMDSSSHIRLLSKTFNAHINVEMCHTISAIKYLCKYFMKGHDCARAGLVQTEDGVLQLDEVKAFVDTRCITPPEATWRLMENPLHSQSHHVEELAVHLENGQRVFFVEDQVEEALRRASTRQTTLMASFHLNQENPDARQYLYQDIPSKYKFRKSPQPKIWEPRKQESSGEMTIGRVAIVSPRDVETYHLRLLLLNVPGATSYEYLRTVEVVEYNT